MCSDAPDTSKINEAALAQANLSAEQLAFIKQIYAAGAPDREHTAWMARAVGDRQLQAMDSQIGLADEYRQDRQQFRGLERGIVDNALAFDTEAKRDELAGAARGDVQQGFADARGQMVRSNSRMGVNPSSGRALALGNEMAAQEALALASGSTRARMQAETMGHALKLDAANLGRGNASGQSTTASLALTAGNNAVTNSNVPNQVNAGGADLMNSGFSGARAGYGSAGQLYGNVANINQQAGDDSAMWGALGSMAGAGIMKYSDKNMKEDIKPVDGDIALSAARKMPVKKWKYKKGSAGDDGGQPHIGPMAQDVHAAAGEDAAPGGKMVNRNEIAEIALAAVQALDKKVTKALAKA